MHTPPNALSYEFPFFSGKTTYRTFSAYTVLERTAGNLAGHSLHRAYRFNCTDQIRTSRERYADEVRGARQQRWQFQTTNGESQKKGASDGGDAPCADCHRSTFTLLRSLLFILLLLLLLRRLSTLRWLRWMRLAAAEYDPSGARLAPE